MADADSILEFIREEADLEEDEVTADTSLFRDQLLDSMNLTALIAFLEEEFEHQGQAHGDRVREPRHREPHAGVRRAQEGGRCLIRAAARTR